MRLTFIGSGNVATHLAAACKNAGHHIAQVYSRDEHNAAILAYHVKAEPVTDLNLISPDTDIFIISVKDDAIGEMASAVARHGKLIVHTSGATSIDLLKQHTNQCGVFYPLQTFSKTREVDFRKVPLCLEAAGENIYKTLLELGQSISNYCYPVSSDQRKILHLAAVFACNFPNYLYAVAEQLLADNQLNFDLIRPLILETAMKVQELSPMLAQTGPAVRNDRQTMDAHEALLAPQPHLQRLYEILSQEIIKMDFGQRRDK